MSGQVEGKARARATSVAREGLAAEGWADSSFERYPFDKPERAANSVRLNPATWRAIRRSSPHLAVQVPAMGGSDSE